MRLSIYIISFVAIVFCSCGRRPGYVIEEKKMTDVLVDIQLAQAIYRQVDQFRTDENKDALIEGVLRKHDITQAELDSSLLWYSDNMEYYIAINDSVASKLKVWNDRLTKQRDAVVMQKRKPDAIIPPLYRLTEATPALLFNIDSSKIKSISVSDFRLKFDVMGLNRMHTADAAVYYIYRDTVIRYSTPLDSNATYTITKPQMADSLLKSISGYVRLRDKIKGIESNVLLYNVSYIDSLSVDKDKPESPGTLKGRKEQNENKSPEIAKPKPSNIDVPVAKPMPLAPKDSAQKKEKWDAPVIRRKDIERNPILQKRIDEPMRQKKN